MLYYYIILVFETNDPEINWDGRYFKNNKLVSSGVYYYIVDIHAIMLSGIEHYTKTGFIHVYSNDKPEINTEK